MGLEEDFNDYADQTKTTRTRPRSRKAYKLYGLYKQATVGPVTTSRPSVFPFSRLGRKWDAWKAVEGKSKEEAMNDFISCAKELLNQQPSASA